jgi:hypothetical protein
MALYIHCGFARVAIRHLTKEHAEANGHHNLGYDIIQKYNVQFGEVPGMKLEGNPDNILKKCKELNATFSQKWHPQEILHSYIATFSPEKWSKLPTSQKLQHSRTECNACPFFFPTITRAFPGRKRALAERNMVDVTVTPPNVSLPPTKLAKKLGQDIVAKLEPTCVELTGGSPADVLQKTPVAGVMKRKQPAQVKKENRDRIRGVKQAIESELQQRDHELLFKNRLLLKI